MCVFVAFFFVAVYTDNHTEAWTAHDLTLFLSLPCCTSRSLKYLSCTIRSPSADTLRLLEFIDHLELSIEDADDVLAAALPTMHNIRWLRLVAGTISDSGLKDVARMSGLQMLHLVSLEHVTDNGVLHFKHLRLGLQWLRICCPHVAGTTLCQLHNVRNLVLHKRVIATATLYGLIAMQQLETLTIVTLSALDGDPEGAPWSTVRQFFAKTRVRFSLSQ